MAQEPNNNKKFEEIDKLHKKGKKLAKGSLFSKANPDDAEKVLDEARKRLRKIIPQTIQSTTKLLLVLDDLAEVRSDMTLYNQAAQTMEEAARYAINCKEDKENKLKSRGPYYYEQASVNYLTHRQYEKSCKMLLLAAKIQNEIDNESIESINKCINYYDTACQIEEDEKRYQLCHEFFDAAIKYCINNTKFNECIKFLERQIIQYENETFKFYKRIYRNIATLMIIQFHLKDVKSAQKIYNESLIKYDEYSQQCGEQRMCEDFLRAFESADAEELDKIQKSGDLGIYLMNCVSRFAKKLNMQDIEPMIVISNDDQLQAEQEQIKEEAKEDVSDEQLASEANKTEIDDTGAPDLLS